MTAKCLSDYVKCPFSLFVSTDDDCADTNTGKHNTKIKTTLDVVSKYEVGLL